MTATKRLRQLAQNHGIVHLIGQGARLTLDCIRKEELAKNFTEIFVSGTSEIFLDADQYSLQWRILNHLADEGLLAKPEVHLKSAWKSARKANVIQRRGIFLSGRQGKAVKDALAALSHPEQWLCYQAAVEGEFSLVFTNRDFSLLVERMYADGRGVQLVAFLSALYNNHRRRGGDKINPFHVVLSLMWVSPRTPLWLMPSQVIAIMVRRIMELPAPPSSSAINSAIRSAGLFRVSEKVIRKFYSSGVKERGRSLHREISEFAEFDIQNCFRGRPISV